MHLPEYLLKHKRILSLAIAYVVLLLTNLKLLPISNDEGIYLDWAWTATRVPGHLYDSLLDAKQPFMLWLFGIAETFFHDPLVAGRFVAILFGTGTLLGIYKLTKKLTDEKTAYVSAVIYVITPIFVFYNRQALMEPAIACIGIWNFYFLLRVLHKPTTQNAIILGIILGIGFFIKTSALLFFIPTASIMLWRAFQTKRRELWQSLGIVTVSVVCVDGLLLINPTFWQTFSTNDRYTLTLSELLHFPITIWMRNILGTAIIGLLFITPLLFLLSIYGLYLLKQRRQTDIFLFLAFFYVLLLQKYLL